MNRSTADNAGAAEKQRGFAASRLRGLVPGLALFATGIALGAWWISRAASSVPATPVNAGPAGLSAATKAVLQHLGSPVEIRFYSLLDPATVDNSGREFSGRVDQLLSQYEQEAGGKIKVVRVNSFSTASANAAMADGIRSFNIDKGDACYLGIAVVHGGQKESLASLAPEWEPALEFDLSRAIAGIGVNPSDTQPAAPVDGATLERGQTGHSEPGLRLGGRGFAHIAGRGAGSVGASIARHPSQGQTGARPLSSSAKQPFRGGQGCRVEGASASPAGTSAEAHRNRLGGQGATGGVATTQGSRPLRRRSDGLCAYQPADIQWFQQGQRRA